MARLAIILVAVTFPASWGVHLGDEDKKDGASLSTGMASKLHGSDIIDNIANFIIGKDPTGLAEKGITMGGDSVKPLNCKGDDESGLGFKETVLKCEMLKLAVKNPPPAPDHNPFSDRHTHVLTIEKIFLHVRCDMGAVQSFIGHQVRTAAMGVLGSWGASKVTGYQGPTMCFLESFEIHDAIVNYETGVHKDDKVLTPPESLLSVTSAERFQTSNVNQMSKLFAPEEEPEEIVEPLPGTELIDWQHAAFRLNKLQAVANGKELKYNRDLNKDLAVLIGSQAKGMLKLYLAIGKLVRNIVYDSIKESMKKDASNAKAGFVQFFRNIHHSVVNDASNDKCCCMQSETCQKFGWSASDNTIKFAFEISEGDNFNVKYCCKVRHLHLQYGKCDTDKYTDEFLSLMKSFDIGAKSKIIYQGKHAKEACPEQALVGVA